MTWQLFSPDLPFLQDLTIKQIHNSFWETVQPYLPLVTAVITGGISFIGILITYNLASKARDIARDQKRIAQEKLEIDVFDKRFTVINSLNILFNFISQSEGRTDFHKFKDDYLGYHQKFLPARFMFEQNDSDIIYAIGDLLNKMYILYCYSENFTISFKNRDKNGKEYSKELSKEEYDELKEEAKMLIFENVGPMAEKYTPKSLRMLPLSNSTTSLASPRIPQPTGLKAIRMRLKRAICEWSRPLQ